MTEGGRIHNLEKENSKLMDENEKLKKQVEQLMQDNQRLKDENLKLQKKADSAISKANALQRGLERSDTNVMTNKMSVETVIDGDIQYEIVTDEDNDMILGQRLIKTNLATGQVLEDREVNEEEVDAILNGEYE